MPGVGVRGSEKGERSPLCETAWVASHSLLFPCHPAQSSESKELWQTQIPRKYSTCKWKVRGETVAHHAPQIPYLFYPGSWDIPGCQVSHRNRQHRHCLPQVQPSPARLTLPWALDTRAPLWKFTQPQRHKCTSSPGASCPCPVLRGHPVETLPSWGLVSTENTTVGPRLIFFF